MSANALLFWMSGRGAGSWPQFRSAVEELHVAGDDSAGAPGVSDDKGDPIAFSLYGELRENLRRLGHAEFSGASGSDWRVAPPALAINRSGTGYVGIISGARSLALLARIRQACDAEPTPAPTAPDCLRILSENTIELRRIAAVTGLRAQIDASPTLLAAIPVVSDRALRTQGELPFGPDWRIEAFDASSLRWRASSRDACQQSPFGLFRFSLRHQRFVYLCTRGGVADVPGSVGKYLVLKKARVRVLQYDSVGLRLTVPAICRPPLLIERALILCSGQLPTENIQRGVPLRLTYEAVSHPVARAAAALLQQELL